jgi:flagellar protein FlaI
MLQNIKNELEKIKFPQLALRKYDPLTEEKEVTGIEPYDREVHGEIVDMEMFLFSWDEIPGNDDEKLRDFLNKNYGFDWVEIAGIEKTDEGMTIEVSDGLLFSWHEIPGKDEKRFKKILEQKYDLDWVETAEINKTGEDTNTGTGKIDESANTGIDNINEGNTIEIFSDDNWLMLTLNDERTSVDLRIDDGTTDEFTVKTVNGNRNIYSDVKNSLLLKLDETKTRVCLKIDDDRTDELIVRTVNDRINIYFEGILGYTEIERYWVNDPFSFVSIQHNKTDDDYIYYIAEPEMSTFEATLLRDIYERSRDLLSYEDLISGTDRTEILTRKVKELIDKYIKDVDIKTFHKLVYYLTRNNIGFGRIDPLMKDMELEDISCSGPDIPVYLYHRRYENIKTNLNYEEEELNSFVFLLAQRSGKNISIAKPYLDATLSDGSRLQETLGREITTRGSSFTIRRFKEIPLTPVDLINFGTYNVEIMAYLWLAVENNKSLILAGGTASGKTTSLNAISLFIPTKAKIVSLEDTRELQLFHENWIAGLTREPFTAGGKGSVDMYDLLRQGLRQRPEYLLVGEVRGKEALTLFQAMSTGHTTYSTMHAGSVQAAINRLENEPINVPRVMITALDILIVQGAIYIQGKRIRRGVSLIEIIDLDQQTKSLNTLELSRWNPINDDFSTIRDSQVLEDIRERRGWTRRQLELTLYQRQQVLQYMVDRNITDYDSVVNIIKEFSTNQEKLIQRIQGEEFS